MLHLAGVRSGYAAGDVLHGIDMSVEDGEVVGIIGRNGVGKTTLIKTVIGLLPLRGGSIRFRGREIGRLSADRRAQEGIGYVPQGREVFPNMTVEENLRVGEFVNRSKERTRYELAYKYFPILRERAKQRAGTMSGGEQQMLAIARALVGDPYLLLLDEPTEGVQPSIVHQIAEVLVALNREERLTILLVEQNLNFIRRVVSRACGMEKGRIVAEFDLDQLSDVDRIAEYLTV